MASQLEQVLRAFGGQIDPASLDTPEARRALLDGLISQRLVMSEAGRKHLFMTKAAVIDAIAQAPEFQENGAVLRGPLFQLPGEPQYDRGALRRRAADPAADGAPRQHDRPTRRSRRAR